MRFLISATVLALALTACGGDSEPTGPSPAEVSASEAAASESASAAAAETQRKQQEIEDNLAAETQATYDACADKTQPLIDALQEISSRLDIGLVYADYGEYIGDAKVAYDSMFDAGDLDYPCLDGVAVPLEKGINNHVDVLKIWGDCIDAIDCDFSEGDANSKAQKKWLTADGALEKAKAGLADLAP